MNRVTRLGVVVGAVAAGMAVVLASVSLAAISVKVVEGFLEDSRPELKNQNIIGVWKGDDGCELAFNGDGTFDALRIPAVLLGPSSDRFALVSGSGEWSIDAAVSDPSGRPTQVELTFDSLENFLVPHVVYLRSDFLDGELILFWFFRDPDLGRRFVLRRA